MAEGLDYDGAVDRVAELVTAADKVLTQIQRMDLAYGEVPARDEALMGLAGAWVRGADWLEGGASE
jgi:hypothetical protein